MTEPSTHGFLCRAPSVNTHPSFHHILSEISGILTVTSFAILDTLLHAQTLSHVQLFCNPMDCNLLGSSAFGIFLARIRQWGAIFLFQGIFPNQGSNPHLLHLLHWQAGSLPLTPRRKPLDSFTAAKKPKTKTFSKV